jgi:hypothetical protein
MTLMLPRAGILLLCGVIVGFIHSKPLASGVFLNVEKAEWCSPPCSEDISVCQATIDEKRELPMPLKAWNRSVTFSRSSSYRLSF